MFAPSADFAVFEYFHGNVVRVAADGTVFPVLLAFALRWIDRNHDLFTARVTNVSCIVVHLKIITDATTCLATDELRFPQM